MLMIDRRHIGFVFTTLWLATLAGCTNEDPTPDSGTDSVDMGEAALPASSPAPTAQAQAAPLYSVGEPIWAVNIGGSEHTDMAGIKYRADDLDSETKVAAVDTIRGSQDPVIYQSYREGELAVSQAVDNGRYAVTLQFMEPEDIASGERVFDVLVEGEVLVSNLDVRRVRDGKHISALDRTVTDVLVTDGELNIELRAGTGKPVISGIIVRRQSVDPRGWQLHWADEFNYQGAPDPDRWTIQQWPAGKVNTENQAYTARPENVRVEGGNLVLEAHRGDIDDAEYSSGRIHSQGKGDVLYGRIDIRAKLPTGQGTWSALWMLPSDPFRYATKCSAGDDWQGQDDVCDAWPNSGEIDIMENVGYEPEIVHATVHNSAYYWRNHEQRKGAVHVPDGSTRFHVYSIEWAPEVIHVYVDGSPYFTYVNDGTGWASWPYDHPYNIVMNLAIGGAWGRAGGPIDNSIFPVRMEVDYVRVFKPEANAAGVVTSN